MTALRSKLAELPRPMKLAGGAIIALMALIVFALGGLSTCQGDDPDDPTLEVTVQQVTTEALPAYCAEDCGRWMVQSPYWYEIEATDDQAAELRSAGWTVNGIAEDAGPVQESHGDDGQRSVWDFLLFKIALGAVIVVAVVKTVTGQWGGKAGPGQ